MEELIEAVEALSQKTIFDYLVVIVPIFISIVAIYISISIANRQNKIALSEKRLEILSVVKLILCFSKSISCIQTNHLENRENIIVAYTSVFGIDISTNENAEFSANSVFRSVNKIERLTIMIEFFFDKQTDKKVEEIVKLMLEMLYAVVDNNKTFITEKDVFCKACSSFNDEFLHKMEKKIKI